MQNPTSAPPPYDLQHHTQYNIYKSTFSRHYDITTADGRPLFHGEVSTFTPGKPDLTLHTGTSDKGPVVATSKFGFIDSFKVVLKGPSGIYSDQCESMTKGSFWTGQYRWAMTLQFSPSHPVTRREFIWKRTRHEAVDGRTASVFQFNYKLVDAQTDQLLAVFTSSWSMRKCGMLQINVQYGKDFETMAFITCLSLYERARRQNGASAGASAGGGGGGGGA